MESGLQKKYGLWTAVAMVVGIVIGSGVFFKAEKVLNATGGNLAMGILAWLIGGGIMITCAYVFALMASKYEKVNGIVDYAEAAFGSQYAYGVGWFMAMIYYPTLTAVLSWVSARYTSVLFGLGDPIMGGNVYALAGFYMVAIFALNFLAPILSGKFQVSTTVIKLIPLSLVAIIGILKGLTNGQIIANFTAVAASDAVSNPLLTSVVATAFAYEGWIIATSINSELHDAKRNLPKALMMGTTIIMVVYIAYFMGLSGSMPTAELIAGGEEAVRNAFSTLLGNLGGSLLFVFVVISCLGTLNGLMLGCTRGIYALAARGQGPNPNMFKQVDAVSDMPTNSAALGLLMTGFWLTVWYGNFAGWWPLFLDVSELPIVTMYAVYIPIFIWMMKNMTELGFFNRVVMPLVAVAGSVFMIYAAVLSHGSAVVAYLVLFAVIMALGFAMRGNKQA